MRVHVYGDRAEMATAAALRATECIREAIAQRGAATIVLATGASQFEMLAHLVTQSIAWPQVTAFHLDEYIGLPESHPASFRRYLRERFVEQVQTLGVFHYIIGDASDPSAECARLGSLIEGQRIDLACIGIGENGHLAFNDPPADFETRVPYLVVALDDACRRQQLGEGWFPTLNDVPTQAISMSISQVLRAERIVCTVPDQRKAVAVKAAIEGPVTPWVPSSILQRHRACDMYLDESSASLLMGCEDGASH